MRVKSSVTWVAWTCTWKREKGWEKKTADNFNPLIRDDNSNERLWNSHEWDEHSLSFVLQYVWQEEEQGETKCVPKEKPFVLSAKTHWNFAGFSVVSLWDFNENSSVPRDTLHLLRLFARCWATAKQNTTTQHTLQLLNFQRHTHTRYPTP